MLLRVPETMIDFILYVVFWASRCWPWLVKHMTAQIHYHVTVNTQEESMKYVNERAATLGRSQKKLVQTKIHIAHQ